MLTLLRWLGGFVLTLALLILLAVLIVPRVVDPNDYRDEITQLVKDKTGRTLALNGDLSISVFPWLGIETQALSLSQPDSIGGEMVSVDKAQLRVKLLPLLSKRVEVDTIVLEEPSIRLVTLANGVSSMDGLTGEDEAEEAVEAESAAVALVIAGVRLSNGSVVIDDRLEASQLEIKNLEMESGNLLSSDFAPLDISGELHDAESPSPMLFDISAKARIDQETTALYMQDVNATVQQDTLDAKFDLAELSLLDAAKLSMKNIDLVLSGDYPLSATIPEVNANLDQETLSAGSLSAQFYDAKADITNLSMRGFSEPNVTANLRVTPFDARELLKQFEVDYQPLNSAALSSVGLTAKLEGSLERAAFSDLVLDLDQSRLTGSATVRNFERPAATFDLKLSDLNVDDYLPPEDDAQEDDISGAEALVLPLAAFKELNANGRFVADSLISGGIKMEDIDVRVKSTEGSVTITPSASLYDGKLDGNIAFTESGDSVLTVKQNVDLVDLGRMLTDAEVSEQLRGLGSLAIDVLVRESNGVQTNQGTIKLQASQGEISGVDMNSVLQRANSVMSLLSSKGDTATEQDATESKGEADEEGITKFAEMSGTFNLNNFVLTNDDFVLKAPAFAVTGEGVIDVAQQTVNYLIEVAVDENISGALGQQLEKIKGQRIPIRCKGALDAPLCLPDAKKLYSNFLAARLDAKKGEFLQEKLGIEGGEKLSTKDLLKQALISKALGKDKEARQPQERPIQERDAPTDELNQKESAPLEEGASEAANEEREEDPKDKLKRKLLEKLFD